MLNASITGKGYSMRGEYEKAALMISKNNCPLTSCTHKSPNLTLPHLVITIVPCAALNLRWLWFIGS